MIDPSAWSQTIQTSAWSQQGNADKKMMEATEMDDALAQRVLRAEDPATLS